MTTQPLSSVFKAEWHICLLLALVAFIGASLFMSGWPTGLAPDLVTPYSYGGDGISYLWNIQRVIEGAWYFQNDRSGFPFGSNHLDYPTADTGSYLVLKLLGISFQSSAAALNLYYLLGFSLCAVSGYLVARTVGVSKYFSIVVALIYSFTSFHFGRIGHLFFTWYFVAPLFFYVGFRLFSKQLVFIDASCSRRHKLLNIIALICLASFGIYYSFFGCLVIVFCTAMAVAVHRSKKHLYEGLLTLSFVVLGVLLNVLPSLIYLFRNGENREGVNRLAAESELYALKIAQLLLPRGDHRLDSFFEFTSSYNSSFPLVTENVSASLGVIGSLGFLMLVGMILITPFVYSRADKLALACNPPLTQLRFQVLAALNLGLVLMGTMGGFSSLFAMLVSTSIRSWNRISIFIAFLAVLAFLMAVDMLILKYVKPRYIKFVSILVACILLVLGILDQTVKPCPACQAMNRAQVNTDRTFVQDIEKSLPKNSAIYQLPYTSYPENGPVNALGSYDQARGHLHSTHLKWSFGGMRGRDGDWFYRKLAHLPIQEQVAVVSAMGFSGIYIDRRGYIDASADNDKKCAKFANSLVARLKHDCVTHAELEQAIASTAEARSANLKIVSNDKQLTFMPLKSTADDAASLQRANAYLLPIGFKLVNGFPVQLEGGFDESIDLRKDDPDLPVYAGSVTGLAGISIANGERIGRWSDALSAKQVTVWLAKPLPKKFTLHITAQAAGLNTEKPMQIKIGKQTKEVLFGSAFQTKAVDFEIDSPIYKIEFKPADPFSPARRWGQGSNNLIAILFQEILIKPN